MVLQLKLRRSIWWIMMVQYKLLNIGHNHKTIKSDKKSNYLTGILYLAPGNISGYEVCPGRSPGCFSSCLYYSGWARRPVVQANRIRKTKLFFEDKKRFFDDLIGDIAILLKESHRKDKKAAVRLNGTSDIIWEKVADPHSGKTIINMFPQVQFYDYTKVYGRHDIPENYNLTYSLSEIPESETIARNYLRRGHNVAVVFMGELPKTFWGYPVIDGDIDDLRWMHKKPCIIGLQVKTGPGNKDNTGFVVKTEAMV